MKLRNQDKLALLTLLYDWTTHLHVMCTLMVIPAIHTLWLF